MTKKDMTSEPVQVAMLSPVLRKLKTKSKDTIYGAMRRSPSSIEVNWFQGHGTLRMLESQQKLIEMKIMYEVEQAERNCLGTYLMLIERSDRKSVSTVGEAMLLPFASIIGADNYQPTSKTSR